ncbi:hypothetical protein PAMA_010053 [Pampus argenteus]
MKKKKKKEKEEKKKKCQKETCKQVASSTWPGAFKGLLTVSSLNPQPPFSSPLLSAVTSPPFPRPSLFYTLQRKRGDVKGARHNGTPELLRGEHKRQRGRGRIKPREGEREDKRGGEDFSRRAGEEGEGGREI